MRMKWWLWRLETPDLCPAQVHIPHCTAAVSSYTAASQKFAHVSLKSFMIFKLFEMTNVSSDQIENVTLFI